MSYHNSARPNSGYTFTRGLNSHHSPTSQIFASSESHSQLRNAVRASSHPFEDNLQLRHTVRLDTAFAQPTYASSPGPDRSGYVSHAPSRHELPCNNCGYTHRCTRPAGSPSTSPRTCYRCVSLSLACTTEHESNYFTEQGSNYFSQWQKQYPAQTSGPTPVSGSSRITGPGQSFSRDLRAHSYYPSRQSHEKHAARSPKSNSSTQSDTLASVTASSPTSHSNGSSATKDAFEPVRKRTQVRGYIPTLDARLSRLESMLGELIPSASQVLKPGEVQSTLPQEGGSGKRPQGHSGLNSCSTYRREISRPGCHDSQLRIPEDPILDGALEDALLARRPVDQQEQVSGNKPQSYSPSYSSYANRRGQTTTANLFLGPNEQHS